MDLMGILGWFLVLVSLVLFIIAMVKASKNWGWLHITLFSILFIECWCMVIFTAGVASRRIGFTRAYTKLSKTARDKEAELRSTLMGEPFDPAPNLRTYIPITNELNRLLVERGRVWRGCTVAQANVDGASLQISTNPLQPNVPQQPQNPAPAPAPAPSDAGVAVQTIIHAFGEKNDPSGLMPTSYLGEFVVTDSNAGAIKLKPTAPLTAEQIASINSGVYGTWAIYELIPLDDHRVFSVAASATDENSIYGRMDQAEISQLLATDPQLVTADLSTLSIKDAIKARVLRAYLNDGGRPPEGTPPENIAMRVEFEKDYSIEVDAPDHRNATEGGFYDLTGRTVDERLKRSAEETPKVSFKKGAQIVLESSKADELIKEGTAKAIAPVFVRLLNDYAYSFREVRRQYVGINQDIQLIERELEESRKSLGIASAQVQLKQDERAKLDKDAAQYRKELEVITGEAEKLQTEVKDMRARLGQLFLEIQSTRDAIAAKQSMLLNGAPDQAVK